MKTEKTYDLAFIGAGLSCSYSLIHFITQAKERPPKSRYKILVVDKVNEFWTGIPYGDRSGAESLIITSLKEFLVPSELEAFVAWIKQNFERLTSDASGNNGLSKPAWVARNEKAIAADQWEKIFVPRYLFGLYMQERVTNLLKTAAGEGVLEYDLVTADITNVEKLDTSYAITAKGEQGSLVFKASKVVLSIGSPPKKYLNNLNSEAHSPLFIEDIYEPTFQKNLEQIKTHLNTEPGRKKNILIVGSNASALETVFNLCNKVDLTLVQKFYIVSPDGSFPNRIKEASVVHDFQPVHLTKLKEQASYTSGQILEAVERDTAIAQEKNISISDIYQEMANTVIELMNKLNYEEQKKFVCNDGVEIGKFQRRAGSEYLDAVEALVQQSKIAFIKGKFIKLLKEQEEQFTIEYFDKTSKQNKPLDAPLDVIINCVGSQELVNSSSELIRNLIQQKICTVNDSKRGFEVNEAFESSKNFFVMGPLLAGNLNAKIRVWHAESCPRIFSLSKQLADELSRTLA